MSNTQYLHIAEQLLAHAQTQSHADAIPTLELAISSLETHLRAVQGSTTSLEEELRARLMLANVLCDYTTDLRRAEDVINRGIMKIGNQEQFLDYRLALSELLSHILTDTGSINAARRVVKDCLEICIERGAVLDIWNYVFLFRSFEMDSTLASVRAIRSLAAKRQHTKLLQMANVLDSTVYVTQGLPIPEPISPQLPKNIDDIPVESFGILDYMHLSVSILGDILAGNVAKSADPEENLKRAVPKLAIIHKGLDLNPNIDTSMRIDLSTSQTLTFTSFSTRRFMIFMYLLSGVVHISDVTSSRSEKFLDEGQRQLSQELSDFGLADPWVKKTKVNLHLYRALNFMLHAKLKSAKIELDELYNMNSTGDFYLFLCGCLSQFSGDLDSALAKYDQVQDPQFRALSMLNTLLIYRGSLRQNITRAKDLQHQLAPLCARNPQLSAAFELCNSFHLSTSSVATKRTITAVLNLAKSQSNTQLNYLALSVLSAKSGDPDSMILKFSSFASNQSHKSSHGSGNSNVWSLFNGRIIESVYATSRQDAEKLAKIRAVNKTHEEMICNSMPAVHHALK